MSLVPSGPPNSTNSTILQQKEKWSLQEKEGTTHCTDSTNLNLCEKHGKKYNKNSQN
jgi:hypothetical protein